MAISMLYAHWEGSIKSLAEYYLNYVSNQNLYYKDLKDSFLALTLKRDIELFDEANKASIHNKFVEKIFAKLEEQSQIPYKGVIKNWK